MNSDSSGFGPEDLGIVVEGDDEARHAADIAFFEECGREGALVGASDEEVKRINARGLTAQRAITTAMSMAMAVGQVHPNAAFAVGLQSLIQYHVTLRDREMVSYLVALTLGVRSMPEGPIALLSGEIEIRAAVKKGEAIPEHLRQQYGMTEEEAKMDGHRVLREGNVLHAEDVFGKPAPVH